MINASPAATFEATLTGAPTGLTGTMGVRILDNAGATTTGRVTAGIAEYPAGSGFYTVTLTAPSTAGQYTVFWDEGSVGPTTTHSEALTVTYTGLGASSPSGGDLVTLAQVRSFLQKAGGDTDQDTEIAAMITAASDAIMREAQREFKTTTSGSTVRTFEYKGGGVVDFAPFDLRSVTLVRLDSDDSSPTTISSSDYRLTPVNTPQGVYTGIQIEPMTAVTRGRFATRVLEITSATWGFSAVPQEVQRACIITVAVWLRRDVTAYENVLGPEGEETAPRSLPMPALDLLAPFKRQVYA